MDTRTDNQTESYPEVDEALLRLLPPILRAVVRALGFDRARVFLKEFGGTAIHIPKNHTPTLGLDNVEMSLLLPLIEPHLNSTRRVILPKSDKLFAHIRDKKIKTERGHTSLTMLARRNNLTVRHIQNICRDDENKISQFDLF